MNYAITGTFQNIINFATYEIWKIENNQCLKNSMVLLNKTLPFILNILLDPNRI